MNHRFALEPLYFQCFLACQSLYAGRLDGAWGSKSEAAALEFDRRTMALAGPAAERFEPSTEIHIFTLHLSAQAAARRAMRALQAHDFGPGITVRVVDGRRSYGEQDALYAQGRTVPGKVVTHARAGESWHNFGLAIDLGVFLEGEYLKESPIYSLAGPVAVEAAPELEWGGTWPKDRVDLPHLQMLIKYDVHQLRDRFEAGLSLL